MHVPRMLRVRISNEQSNCKQRYSENPLHGFKTFPHWFLRQRSLTVTSTNHFCKREQGEGEAVLSVIVSA